MKEKIEFAALDCGHAINPNIGLGMCKRCSRKCCAKCLQLIEADLLCPSCYMKFINRNRGDCCG